MKKSLTDIKTKVLAAVLTIVALAVGQSSAWAQTFKIEPSYNSSTHKTTFTITRSGSSLPQQTIYYRTVNLSAYAGQHYTAVTGTFTFPADETKKEVKVEELTPGSNAYAFMYQTGTSRSYRFEVLDINGFELALIDRDMSNGLTGINSTNAFGEKNVTVNSGEITVKDENYAQAYHEVPVATYFSNAAPKNYLMTAGAELRMTLSFQAKEKDDGYQHLQILVNHPVPTNNQRNWDEGAGDNNPGTINYSSYMATFCHKGGSTNTTYANYSFPVTSVGNRTYDKNNLLYAWSGNSIGDLRNQTFNTNCRADDGRLVISTKTNLSSFSTLGIRFDASGDGEDTWYAYNTVAHIQAVDATKPTLYNNSIAGITVSGGPYVKGNTFYISVPFSEIVHITGNDKQLETSWGPVTYESGDYSNVITFKGTITADAVTTLKITGITNAMFRDLANNYDAFYNNSFNKTFTGVTCTDTYTLVATNTVFTGLNAEYVVINTTIEPHPTIYFYKGKKETANRVTLTENTNYTLSWTDNSAAGTGTIIATGAGSYTGSISTTFPIRWSTYTVRFHSNYDTDATSEQPFTYSTAQVLTPNTYSRTGYTYNGWSTTTDGSVVYTDGQEVLNLTTTDGAVVDLYAHWTANTYTVTLDNQSATTAGTTSVTATFDAAMPAISVPVRTGYTFGGYYTEANGGGTKYYNAAGTSANSWNIASATTLYAKLTANNYTVRFNANGGKGAMSDMAFTYDAAQNLTANAFARTGCTFAGWSTTADGSGDSYTDGQNVTNLTVGNNDVVTLYAQWTDHWGITDDADGSENKPYTITTPAGLDLLASDVNNGINEYGGKYFKLGADITYTNTTDWNDSTSTENNYTAIGNNDKAFCGIFDGYSHTVSGIRIYKPDAYYQGLFGRVWEGTVKNVTLTDARITGFRYTGGIFGQINGYNYSTIQNCLVLNTAINGKSCGAVMGRVHMHANLITNYYYGCTVNGKAKAANVGTDSGDNDGVCSVHSLTLPLDVTATGESVTIGTDIYYISNTTVTLNIPTGYVMSSVSYNDGTDHDITGNTFTMPAADVTVSATLTDLWDITSGKDGSTAEKAYTITSTAGLDLLATLVNGGNDFYGKYFKLGADITYTNTTDWNDATSTENNYTAIGSYVDGNWRYFSGTFDGQGHTVRGIRIYKGGTTTADSYQGLFGRTSGATIRNVILADARITGKEFVGGIAGFITDNAGTGGIVENCRVGSDVTIHAVSKYAYHHGGVVGRCNVGTISGCVSSATLTVTNGLTGINSYGGIVGSLGGNMSDCLSIDVSVPDVNRNGAIAGEVASNCTLTNNYYYCTVGGATTNVGVGYDIVNTTPHDRDGARSIHTLTLGTGITATGESVTNGTDIYYASNTTVTLNVPAGYVMSSVSYNDGTDHDITGNTFTMPAADVTVSATLTDLWDITSGKDGSTAEKAYTITSTAGLDLLATLVNGGNDFYGKYFKLGADITYTNTTDWNDATSTENNYTAIGGYSDGYWRNFRGTFDGQNHTVRGIRIYKGGDTDADDYQGLFGRTRGATIRNVILTDARITGKKCVGGIAGYRYKSKNAGKGGIVENCRVGSDVCIHAVVDNAYSHGGVLGVCDGGTISGCVSSATLTVANDLTGIKTYGGIVGHLIGKVSNCLAIGASVPDVDMNGAIAGDVDPNYTLTNNYYYNCTVGGATTNVGVGYDISKTTPHDRDGARSVHSVTLPTGVTATGESVTNGTDTYYVRYTTVRLNIPTGYVMSSVSYNDGTDHDITGNTFTMPAADVTVSATLTDLWDITSGKDGTTADKAYTITTTAGMELLATKRNAGNDFSGKYFKLGGNIEYDSSIENNHTAIGTNTNPFNGIFDGNGYTVSGIKIQSDESYQGLFGVVASGGVVRNVVVQGADIRGNNYVGGVVGKIYGILENCFVVETLVSGEKWVGIIWGDYDWGSLGINCHYLNCCNTRWDSGFTRNDMYTITAGTDVLLSINSYDRAFEYKGVLYFPENANVSLDLSYTGTVPEGDVPVFFTNNGSLSRTANSYTWVVLSDATIGALMGKPDISYIDSIGTVQVCPAAVPITDHEGDIEYDDCGWYVVNGQVTVNGDMIFYRKTHLILCDGATLTADAIIASKYDLNIYTQSNGDDMGCINSFLGAQDGTLIFNGGNITTKEYKKYEEAKGIGILAENIVINSGIINAIGDSIICHEDLVLGWRNTTDRVTAGGYRSYYFIINPGQVLTDGNDLYYGCLNQGQIDELSGKTLMPYPISDITESDGITDVIASEIAGKVVSFSRDYTSYVPSTICLPFSLSSMMCAELYRFLDVTYDDMCNEWVATMVEIETDYHGILETETEAGKPYLIIPYEKGQMSYVGRVPDDISPVAGATTSGDWTFHGTYSRKDYGDEGFSGTVFGFAGKNGKATDGVTDVEAGQFVKAGNGAYILPFRAYLTYSGSNTALHAPGRGTAEIPAIPDRIKVRLLSSDGGTTATGTIDMNTGEITIDQWYYLNGQPVNGAPAAPGLYLNSDGKKVMLTE